MMDEIIDTRWNLGYVQKASSNLDPEGYLNEFK